MSESSPSSDALRSRAQQWARFAAWELRSEAVRHRSLASDLAWLADAMELARRLAPDENPAERLREKVAHLARVRSVLAAIGRRQK